MNTQHFFFNEKCSQATYSLITCPSHDYRLKESLIFVNLLSFIKKVLELECYSYIHQEKHNYVCPPFQHSHLIQTITPAGTEVNMYTVG